MSTFGKMVRKIRRAQDITQQTCATALGCSRGYICEVEKGTQHPGYEKVARLAAVLNANRDIFLMAAGHVPLELREQAARAPQQVTHEYHRFMHRIRGYDENES